MIGSIEYLIMQIALSKAFLDADHFLQRHAYGLCAPFQGFHNGFTTEHRKHFPGIVSTADPTNLIKQIQESAWTTNMMHGTVTDGVNRGSSAYDVLRMCHDMEDIKQQTLAANPALTGDALMHCIRGNGNDEIVIIGDSGCHFPPSKSLSPRRTGCFHDFIERAGHYVAPDGVLNEHVVCGADQKSMMEQAQLALRSKIMFQIAYFASQSDDPLAHEAQSSRWRSKRLDFASYFKAYPALLPHVIMKHAEWTDPEWIIRHVRCNDTVVVFWYLNEYYKLAALIAHTDAVMAKRAAHIVKTRKAAALFAATLCCYQRVVMVGPGEAATWGQTDEFNSLRDIVIEEHRRVGLLIVNPVKLYNQLPKERDHGHFLKAPSTPQGIWVRTQICQVAVCTLLQARLNYTFLTALGCDQRRHVEEMPCAQTTQIPDPWDDVPEVITIDADAQYASAASSEHTSQVPGSAQAPSGTGASSPGTGTAQAPSDTGGGTSRRPNLVPRQLRYKMHRTSTPVWELSGDKQGTMPYSVSRPDGLPITDIGVGVQSGSL